MGRIAAETLLARIEDGAEVKTEIAVEPELVVRKSTAPVPQGGQSASPSSSQQPGGQKTVARVSP
jgi:hypothetical protein